MKSRSKKPAQAGIGSPQSGEPMYLAVGFLRRPHGLRGELLMDVLTDFPERLKPGTSLYLGDEYTPATVATVRSHNKGLLIHFSGLDSPEVAANYRNTWVFVRADDRPPLPEGEYYFHQLLGLRVETDAGQYLGQIAEIIETGANDVFVVRQDGFKDVLIPMIDSVVLEVDLAAGLMRVHPLPGLLDI